MKAAGSYESIIRGVSQQVPQDRAIGQHTEQVNMWSDPVNGLVRRHGSVLQGEAQQSNLQTALTALYTADTSNYNTLEYTVGDDTYAVMVRRAAMPSFFTAASFNKLPFMLVYNTTTQAWVPLSFTGTAAMGDLEEAGVAAITAVGRFLILTGNDLPVTGTSTAKWDTTANLERSVIWVRGGAYSRTYRVILTKLDNSRHTFTYTTPTSSYQGVLDTSVIAAADPEYTKKVNDLVNAYNNAVTAWIGTSTAAIAPSQIAIELQLLISGAAIGVTATTEGSHVLLTGVKSIEVDDSGDGSLIRGVADEVESVDKTSVMHWVGKVVKVRSRNANEAFYLKAVARDKAVTTGFTEVTWVEGAGVEHAVTGGFYMATVESGSMYVAESPAALTTASGVTTPSFSVSTAGDSDSAARPYFIGQNVTYLDTFQNRLLVGAGGVLVASKIDDYFNFFRSTVLTAPADDPVEMQAQGPSDDILRHGTLYDQNLVVFGDKRQYVINGKVALSPASANMSVMSNYGDSAGARPVSAGGFIFYANAGDLYSSVNQIQPGQNENSPESFPASSQVDSYIAGRVIEMSSRASPSTLFVRASGSPNSVLVFGYVDMPDGRKLDTWSRWDFNTDLGVVIGITQVTDGVLVFSLRAVDGIFWTVADLVPVSRDLSTRPYLDSQRTITTVTAGTGSVDLATTDDWHAAFDATGERFLIGAPLAEVADLQAEFPGEPGLVVGCLFDAYFEPTNPYMRDASGKAILHGRLTVGNILVAFRNSSGWRSEVMVSDVATSEVTFNGRLLDSPDNLVGIVPVTDGQATISVGRETRKYTLRINALTWLPLTVTALEWVGQFFNRVQRF